MKSLLHTTIHEDVPDIMPVIPTMDIVVFPHTIVPLLVLDEKIIKGINRALEESKTVLLLAAKKQTETVDAIGMDDLYTIGTIASIMRLIRIPEGGIKILVQGISRAKAVTIVTQDDTLCAQVEKLDRTYETNNTSLLAQIKNIKILTEKIALSGNAFSPDFHVILSKMQDPEKIADFILSHLNLSVEQSQELLEKETPEAFLENIYHYLAKEIEVSEMQEKIKNSAREAMNKSQKEYYLREQLKAIKKELGEDDAEDIANMREQLEKLQLCEEVKKEIIRNINRLENMSPDSLEAAVTRNYLEWIFDLPWNTETTDNLDIANAQKILDEDHHGLKEIKDRILDFISVRNLKNDGYAPILCFVGPPGTGKTSLGKSIAKSMGRSYIRISLGGVRDEAEIRGHRRTYVGAMPGRFIQALRKAKSSNPVIIIDELDKIGADFRGDPSAAMLEVLDPQQNKAFYDNYLGVPFDLSKVMFIATANSLDSLSVPLRDRMEVIQLSGYTVAEKVSIAQKHLMTRAIAETGLNAQHCTFSENLVEEIIVNYTREWGVRQLERMIRKLCSKAARLFVEKKVTAHFDAQNLETFLGPRKFAEDIEAQHHQIGITNGLAYTAYGGEMIKIEAVLMPGKGALMLTGQLGEVMKESAQAALSYARAHAKDFGIAQKIFTEHDLHIHVPAGAVPKDGPSAGITMLTSILSALTQRPINAQYAMTGELNLRGNIMPIGGVKEKILAAKRNNMLHVILPSKNKSDILGLEEVIEGINIVWVDHADEVIQRVLLAA